LLRPEAVRVVAATWPGPVPEDLLDRHRQALVDVGPERAARGLVAEVAFHRRAAGRGWTLLSDARSADVGGPEPVEPTGQESP